MPLGEGVHPIKGRTVVVGSRQAISHAEISHHGLVELVAARPYRGEAPGRHLGGPRASETVSLQLMEQAGGNAGTSLSDVCPLMREDQRRTELARFSAQPRQQRVVPLHRVIGAAIEGVVARRAEVDGRLAASWRPLRTSGRAHRVAEPGRWRSILPAIQLRQRRGPELIEHADHCGGKQRPAVTKRLADRGGEHDLRARRPLGRSDAVGSTTTRQRPEQKTNPNTRQPTAEPHLISMAGAVHRGSCRRGE